MNESQRDRERGWRWATVWMSMISLRCGGGGGLGGNHKMPPAIQMSVMCSASEGVETIPLTVGDGDSWPSRHSCRPRGDAPPQRVNGKCGEEIKAQLWLIKTVWPWIRRQETRATRDTKLVCQTMLTQVLCPPSICPSWRLHLHYWQKPRWLRVTGAFAAKPCNLCALSFLPVWIWKGKGTIAFSITLIKWGVIWFIRF